jgi:hypothetical protein
MTPGELDLGAASRLVCRAEDNHMALSRTYRITLGLVALLSLGACVPQNNAPKAASAAAVSVAPGAPTVATAPITTTDVAAPQPRTATYSCAGGDRITIENLGTSLHVLSADGTAEDLPASPANQNSRYQEAATHDAIVIDGREALVMKRGKTPVSCKR